MYLWLPPLLVVGLAGAYRIHLGGVGAAAEVGMIITAVLLGILAQGLMLERSNPAILPFCLLLGLALSAVGFLWALAVPGLLFSPDFV